MFYSLKITAALILCTLLSVVASAQYKTVPVFVSGTEGHKIYRIPAIVNLPNGNLLAFAEGRVNGSGDYGDINIVQKKSTDKGKTWSPLQIIVDADTLQAGNPAPVVDITNPAWPKGRIMLFYNTGNNHESEIRKGRGVREVMYITSTDGGATWNSPVNITTQVHRPKQPAVNAAYNFSEDWRHYANTPGHAMQFRSGKYKGRIFVAANHSSGDPQPQGVDYAAHGFYTDDNGKTFQVSEVVNIPGSNESTASELSNNKLIMNSRNQKGDIRARIVSISSNGGASWDTSYFDHTLIDPVNQGSILHIGSMKGKNIVAFCNTAHTKQRDNLTLRISFDEARTWKYSYTIDKSPDGNQKNFTAYSDLVKMSKNEVGVLYEKEGYTRIVFTVAKWKKRM